MAMLPDENRNGVPDILEKPGSGEISTTRISTVSKITINGKEYDRLEDVPEQFRDMIKAAGGSGYRASMSLETRSDDDGITLRISRGMLVFIVIVVVVAAVLAAAYFM